MSNQHRRKTRVDVKLLEVACRSMLLYEGCTCAHPEIVWPKHPRRGEVAQPRILHDNECPLADTGTTGPPFIVNLPTRDR